jgi:hypothetical protein
MRLKSEIWVKAYVRRCAVVNVPAVIVHRGDADAGVIFLRIYRLDGTAELFGPAPAGLAADDGERQWTSIAGPAAEANIDARVARERDLDPDAWIIDVEDRAGRHFLDGWLAI